MGIVEKIVDSIDCIRRYRSLYLVHKFETEVAGYYRREEWQVKNYTDDNLRVMSISYFLTSQLYSSRCFDDAVGKYAKQASLVV